MDTENIVFCCRSLGRYNTITKHTVAVFEEYLKSVNKKLLVFVEPHEFDLYKKSLLGCSVEVINIGQSGKGIWYVSQFIHDYIKSIEGDIIFYIDDDLVSLKDICGNNNFTILKNNIPFFIKAFSKFDEVGIIGFNKIYNPKSVKMAFYFANVPQMGTYLIRKDCFCRVPDNLFRYEDMFQNFNTLLNKKKLVLRFEPIIVNNLARTNAGGLQTLGEIGYREKDIISFEILKESFPVKLRERRLTKVDGVYKPICYFGDFYNEHIKVLKKDSKYTIFYNDFFDLNYGWCPIERDINLNVQ